MDMSVLMSLNTAKRCSYPQSDHQPRIVEYEAGNCTKGDAKVLANECPIEILFHDESAFQAHDAQEKLGS